MLRMKSMSGHGQISHLNNDRPATVHSSVLPLGITDADLVDSASSNTWLIQRPAVTPMHEST